MLKVRSKPHCVSGSPLQELHPAHFAAGGEAGAGAGAGTFGCMQGG